MIKMAIFCVCDMIFLLHSSHIIYVIYCDGKNVRAAKQKKIHPPSPGTEQKRNNCIMFSAVLQTLQSIYRLQEGVGWEGEAQADRRTRRSYKTRHSTYFRSFPTVLLLCVWVCAQFLFFFNDVRYFRNAFVYELLAIIFDDSQMQATFK